MYSDPGSDDPKTINRFFDRVSGFGFRWLCFEIKLESRYFFGKQIFESEPFRIGCSDDESASKYLTEATRLAKVNIFTIGVLISVLVAKGLFF